jgi:hypothetical protein
VEDIGLVSRRGWPLGTFGYISSSYERVLSFLTRSGMTSSTRGSLVDYTEKEQRLRPPQKHQPLRRSTQRGAISGYCSAMRSRASRADFATRGSAISFLTLASVASRDSRISFFSGLLRRCHRPQANAGQLRTVDRRVQTESNVRCSTYYGEAPLPRGCSAQSWDANSSESCI